MNTFANISGVLTDNIVDELTGNDLCGDIMGAIVEGGIKDLAQTTHRPVQYSHPSSQRPQRPQRPTSTRTVAPDYPMYRHSVRFYELEEKPTVRDTPITVEPEIINGQWTGKYLQVGSQKSAINKCIKCTNTKTDGLFSCGHPVCSKCAQDVAREGGCCPACFNTLKTLKKKPKKKAPKKKPKIEGECSLCMDAKLDGAFSCGHTACFKCAQNIARKKGCCPFCRKSVTAIKLYA